MDPLFNGVASSSCFLEEIMYIYIMDEIGGVMANSDPVGSLLRGIEILKRIGNSENGLKISELSAEMNLKQPTCYNLVRTLMMSGIVEKRNSRLYLSQEFLQLANNQSRNKTFAAVETELLSLYQRLHGCTVIFAVPGPAEMCQTHRISFDRPGVIQHLSSEPMHLYASAAGLVYLAYLDGEANIFRVNERWPFAEFGAHLWKNRKVLNEYLAAVRKTGIAISPFDQEVSFRISSAILDKRGGLIASVGATLPAPRIRDLSMEWIRKEVQVSSRRIASVFR